MSEDQINPEMRAIEERLRRRYSRLTKFLFLIGIILIIAFIVVISGIIFWDNAYNWAVFSLERWTFFVALALLIIIILDLIVYFHYNSYKNKRIRSEKATPEYIDGKRVHVFIYPKCDQGGIFSKTYVKIDDHNILRIKTLIIPPGELWK